jgi:ubiquinone/menaquinone biosynthesis C-methylase UbiE
MPFVNESVDVVTESSVLHHIGDWKSALKESIRVCRKSGRVVLDSEPSKAQMAWSRFAITVFNLRFPVYKLLSYVSSSKYIFRDTEKAKLNLLAEIHHQPGTGFPMDEFETIFADAGFCVEIIPYATPELNSIARPNWQAIVLNLLSARNPWNPKYGPITAIGYSK